MKKYKVGIVGFFANGKSKAGGQEAKTCTIDSAMKEKFGMESVYNVDTTNWKKNPFKLIQEILSMALRCENIIMLPAHNGVKVFVPLFSILNYFFHRKLHYVVIGGWLSSFLDRHKWINVRLKKFDGIYVETTTMKNDLDEKGFINVSVMPNFKDLTILKPEELVYTTKEPYKLCTFSRVMKEKGVEVAVYAVKEANRIIGHDVFLLDIYGQIDEGYKEQFRKLSENFPKFITYKGIVPYDKSVETLKEYFALLFPTFYDGEGFAGTLIDAMAAGVPVVASDWKYNSEIVVQEKTGVLLKECNKEKIVNQLIYIYRNPEQWNSLKYSALIEAEKYRPEKAIKPLLDKMI